MQRDPAYIGAFLFGRILDVGCGVDSIDLYRPLFPGITEVVPWDVPDGDAQFLETLANESFDSVYSSHCLEHLRDARVALTHWVRVVRRGGFVIVRVPDFELYEHAVIPSMFNEDHKLFFTTNPGFRSDAVIFLPELVNNVCLEENCTLMRLSYNFETFIPGLSIELDQTRLPVPECSLEFVLRKE